MLWRAGLHALEPLGMSHHPDGELHSAPWLVDQNFDMSIPMPHRWGASDVFKGKRRKSKECECTSADIFGREKELGAMLLSMC